MCEAKDDTTDNTEQSHGLLREDQANQNNNGVGKFDIGDFVHNQRKIRLLIMPWIRFYHTIFNIVSWKSFYVSLFWMSTNCFIAVMSPIYFVILPLAYVSLLMIISGVKQWGAQGQKEKKLKYGTIKKKADDNDLNVKVTVEKQAHEDIKEFISLLIQLDAFNTEICTFFEKCQRILKWEDLQTSVCVLFGLLLAILVLCFIPIRLLILSGILCVFCLNFGFRPVARSISLIFGKYLKKLVTLLGINELFPSRDIRRIPSQSANSDLQDEWFDAAEDKSDTGISSDDDGSDTNDAQGEQSSSQRKLDSKSVLSQIADFRRKQKKLNSGTCSSCDVPFSILKKRQYCRHCGKSFCSRCCSHRVKRSVFGATAPAAYEETVLVCNTCYDLLMKGTPEEQPSGAAR
ncbi:protrudin-like [Actinia tenebrosa]|uniref:Protrudin n=1 Tax=Actinia tenebrosa TaxID=6105 RepID=A0A6P8IWI5_ACTTE|nr:protrudin-like [Actinia tenebrosa]